MFDGMFLGLMSFTGLAVVYNRLPGSVQLFAQKHPFLTDVVVAVFFYQVMGLTITAHFAVIMQSLMTTAALHVVKHKEDFIFLYDAVDLMKSKVRDFMGMLKTKSAELNAANRAAKLNQMTVVEISQ